MSGVVGYVLGYDAGRSDAEVSHRRREVVDRIFYGHRPVQVDQSYLDQLHQLIEKLRSDSDFNYDQVLSNFTAKLFTGEARRCAARGMRKPCGIRTQRSRLNSRELAAAGSGSGGCCSGAGRPPNDP